MESYKGSVLTNDPPERLTKTIRMTVLQIRMVMKKIRLTMRTRTGMTSSGGIARMRALPTKGKGNGPGKL